MDEIWLTRAALVSSRGICTGAVRIAHGRIAAMCAHAPRRATRYDLRGRYLSAGFIDAHVWGSPATLAREVIRGGTTAFLCALGPEPPRRLTQDAVALSAGTSFGGAECLGVHLEGPFLSPARGGALPRRWIRRPSLAELQQLWRSTRGRLRLVTLAPELPGALNVIRWCRRHGVIASLGHSDAGEADAARAVDAGSRAVTHVFNGMPPFHHRHPSLLDVALRDPRLTAMAIVDGVHMSPLAFRLLVRAKGPERVALVTDSIARQGWAVTKRGGAFYTTGGTLAGSCLTMIAAVRNAVRFGGVSLADAVGMATEVPARLLGERARGALRVGARADLVVFDQRLCVAMTMVGGEIVYRRGGSK